MAKPPLDHVALAVDLGSGALKVGAVSLTGEIAAVEQRTYETERLPGGGAIQDASAWWEMVRELARSALDGI
ncbi:MAG: xylulokinase, partial [Solirubrobacterales bacterium]|nr:xylulokinase [Solirubrobacterales bacterium]